MRIPIISQASSYASTVSGLAKNPTHLLGLSGSSFLQSLSGTTLESMRGRGDPSLACFWDISLPSVPVFEAQQSTLGLLSGVTQAFGALSTVGSIAATVGGATGLASGLSAVGDGFSAVSNKLNQANSWVNKNLGNPVANVKLDPEYVEAITLVFPEYSNREIFRGGMMRKYPDTIVTLGDLNLTLYADDDNKSFKYILNWLNLVSTPGSQGSPNRERNWTPPSIYKKTITVVLMDVNSNDIYTVDYVGCWPKTLSDVSLGAEGDRLTYDVTFSADNAYAYGFKYVSFTEELGNIASGALSYVGDMAMNKAGELISGAFSGSSSGSGS